MAASKRVWSLVQAAFVLAVITFLGTGSAYALGTALCPHTVDGAFSSPAEWQNCSTAISSFFPLTADGAGGAYLYVDQGRGSHTLNLLYDYVNGTSHSSNSFFEVFFQVQPQDTDYLVQITGNTLTAFEKPTETPSLFLPDGSFDTSSVWSALQSDDLALANFQGAVGFGPSPNSSTDHLIAEFQLSVNGQPDGSNPDGIYSPDPAFWSASKGGTPDPPISSGIFQLNPDGTTLVLPVFGPNGDPVLQANVPEPATMWLMVAAGLGAVLVRRWRSIGIK